MKYKLTRKIPGRKNEPHFLHTWDEKVTDASPAFEFLKHRSIGYAIMWLTSNGWSIEITEN